MKLTTPTPQDILDLSGLHCPHLVSATIKALRGLQTGQVLQVITTDLSSPSNMTAWSRQSGHRILDLYEEDGRFIFYFERGEELFALSEPEAGGSLANQA